MRGMAESESFCFHSVDIAELKNITIGVIDILGRYKTEKAFGDLFGASPRFKHVCYLADLHPLLTFGMVDAVFVSEAQASKLAHQVDTLKPKLIILMDIKFPKHLPHRF